MKKIFLLLLLPIACFSQELNFGLKTGLAFIGTKRENGERFFNTKNPVYFTGMIEYKSIDVAGEFNLTYYSTNVNDTDIKALIPEIDIKYYPVDNFNIKTGFYFNSSSLDYKGSDPNIKDENVELKDMGLVIGMEAIIWKGLFAETKFLIDLNKSDKLNTSHMILGIGYKI